MCRAHPDGGRRCPKNPTGRAIDALGQLLRKYPERAPEICVKINTLREARARYGPVVSHFALPLEPGIADAIGIARRVGNPLVVGGAVRDAALGHVPKDIDIEVHGTTIEKLTQRFKDHGYRVDEVGVQFGVLKVSKKGVVTDLDVAVPRRENKVGAGHRGFAVSHDAEMTVEEAAERRDFTVNAMMIDPELGVLVDPFNGAADLKTKTLRHVSDKFAEDPLRVLRGVQMAGRFGMTLDPSTASLCRNLRPEFATLATERVQEEWAKLYAKSTRPELAIKALQDSGWDDTIPGLRKSLADSRTVKSLARLQKVDPEERIPMGAAMVAVAMDASDRKVFLNTTVRGKDAQTLAEDLVTADPAKLETSYARKAYAYTMAKRGFTFDRYLKFCGLRGDLAGIRVARAAIRDGIGAEPEAPYIQGRDVMAAGSRKPGPWVGDLVAEARERQYRGEFSGQAAALAWLASVSGKSALVGS